MAMRRADAPRPADERTSGRADERTSGSDSGDAAVDPNRDPSTFVAAIRPIVERTIRREIAKWPALKHHVDDLCQDVMLRALSARTRVRSSTPSALRAWLRSITRRHLSNAARKVIRYRNRVGSLEDLRQSATVAVSPSGDTLASLAVTPVDSAESTETRRAVTRALQSIGERARGIVLDRIVANLTLDDISTRRRVSKSTVQRDWATAMRTLRRVLNSCRGDRPTRSPSLRGAENS
jgi:RNA polymerase sigma factor (sigma-70 family)